MLCELIGAGTIVGYHPALGEHSSIKLKYTQMIAIPK